ncbi:serine threonine- kinase Sgk2 protein [Rutstroemia sp. NJR-2017a BVV2]|nr:serine threonine- kinase Sgk2 protein [Rutstroemia sp. NJR-2017a BVV2]
MVHGEVRPLGRKHPNDDSILPFDDPNFCCLVVSPFGHPLDKFDTVLEFLEGCRDAIKEHRSLYLDGKILHQDISKDNIIIPEIKRPGDPQGILVNLDLAMELAIGPKKPGEIIRIKAFIAIELLAPGSWDILARTKSEDMAEESFAIIGSEFSPAFKSLEGLARDLRKVLFFPSPDGSLSIGMKHEPQAVRRLYDKLISSFDQAADFYAQRVSVVG